MESWGVIVWLIGLSVMTFFAVAWLLDVSNRQRQIQERSDEPQLDAEGADYSEPMRALAQRIADTEERTQQLSDELHGLTGYLPDSIQCVGLVRFQAFSDYGGDQSFALALANPSGDGIVLSGIYAREGTRVYAKPLITWSSSYSLSFEEEEAINQAQSQLNQGEKSV
jgi:cell division protein FtsB